MRESRSLFYQRLAATALPHPAALFARHAAKRRLDDCHVLAGFDGMFFIPPSEKIPEWLVAKMMNSRCRVAVLDEDESEAGLLSVVIFPARMEQKLFDHLAGLGHRRIDCVNTQIC
jgi:DNA-binding LacI/PurR family transcriptional regulator